MSYSSGSCLPEGLESPLTVRKYAQICLVSFELATDSEKYLHFAARINYLVLFLYFLYSVHCFSRCFKYLEAFAFSLCLG